MPKILASAIVALAMHASAQSVGAKTAVTRATETTQIHMSFATTSSKAPSPAKRYWGAGSRSTLAYPALLEIEYSVGPRRYLIPKELTAGIGSVNVESIDTASTESLVVRDEQRWTVIILRGGDGSGAFIAEWRIERSTGCVIRYVRDLEAPGRIGTPHGPEVLFAQAIEKNGS